MHCSEKGISVLATILIIIQLIKPIFRHEQEIDESCPQVQTDRWWPFWRLSWLSDKAHIKT